MTATAPTQERWGLEQYRQHLKAQGRPTRRHAREEHESQVRFFLFVDLLKARWAVAWADELEDVWAVPNGGHRHAKTAAAMKAEGVRRGVLDIECWVITAPYHGLAIELKSRDGRLTPEQDKRITRLRRRGYRCEVCRSWSEAGQVLCEYLGIRFDLAWITAVELEYQQQYPKRRKK